jgi:hypothetical protein
MVLSLIISCCSDFEGRHKIPQFCVAVPAGVVAWGVGSLVGLILQQPDLVWAFFFVAWLAL